ncbi:helix-turn-helix transcriptional regulator [Planctobacterium marinum]|uniref:helix-turn-helix transcriptional regulator n=1 Tax=Planctobacterium marinum TaxID=1631968 RepID=UPI001E39D2BA|nr:helix-turn-helix transcriptional regulator [Planctobacterium marinum]MCC2603786.1 helix-turn-helix domain-containing protein [Planctobacterium marinum]
MALKSNSAKHQEKSAILRELRKDAGLTQQQLAGRLSISRETLVGIENCYLQQIESLTSDIEDRWWEICRTTAKPQTKEKWHTHILRKLNIKLI